jgi:hypothetical protein
MMEGHVGAEDESRDYLLCLNWVAASCEDVVLGVVPENLPKGGKVHVFEDGLAAELAG